MTLIDNRNRTLHNALQNALTTADRVDIAVGFFYFSGFQALAEQLKDKKVRILVGLEVDPTCVPEIAQYAKEDEVDLSRYQPRRPTASRMTLKSNYVDTFVGFMNDSDIFDDDKSIDVFELYMQKIENGTLEIRKTAEDFHGKFYLLHNRPDASANGDFPGTVFSGSSNLSYKGLMGQGELNDSTREPEKLREYQKLFEDWWSDSKSIAIADSSSKDDFIQRIKPRIWKYQTPDPYYLYIRVLHEMFKQDEFEDLQTPASITSGQFIDLEYQIDAVKMVMDRLHKYDGALLADVVGLGKSVISAAVARNLDMKTVVIAPPHLRSQWEDYKEDFGIRGSRVFSSGNIAEVYERYKSSSEPILFILDEAHRYRNEDTYDYMLLHQICRCHEENKILLLTATPFNNDPKDVFALLKLFQTPGLATIRSVDNLSLRYRELIQEYKKLRRAMTKHADQATIDRKAEEIAAEQRRLIEPIIIRRSRLDLDYITRYREDLKQQGIEFAEVRGPELMEYDLGVLTDLYLETLETITKTEDEGFIGARYKPTSYMNDESKKRFIEAYKADYEDIEDIAIAQSNLAQFMRRLLVTRFESSKFAFRSTLKNMIASNELIESWWHDLGKVPIMKKGQLPDPREYALEDGESADALAEELGLLRENKKLIEVDLDMLSPDFITDVQHDTKLLKAIEEQWFGDDELANIDPKLDELKAKLEQFLAENPLRKIIIFSSYADTVNYLYEELQNRGLTRVARYTAAEGSDTYKKTIKANFDASEPSERQQDDFDILVATDALSEGFNLHRAGIVINYDIPYNPTRVIQRVGRINRINKKVFEYLYVYNCFPSAIGEEETKIRLISTLKIKLINSVVGSDTKTLTSDERLESFFKDEFDKAQKQDNQLSWDTKHREEYEKALQDAEVMKRVMGLPRRSRIKRQHSGQHGVVVFGQKGENSIFTFGENREVVNVISAEAGLPLFQALPEERPSEVDQGFGQLFKLAKDKLFAKHELPSLRGRREKAIKALNVISAALPQAKDYCNDVIMIIQDLDDISDGALRDIAKLDLRNIEAAYAKLLEIVPESYVKNIQTRADRAKEEKELLLFAEQLT